MKRSEFVNVIHNALLSASDGFVKPGVVGFSCPYQGEDKLRLAAEAIAAEVDDLGFLPPTNTCKLIPDEIRGGMKHSPAERKYDEE